MKYRIEGDSLPVAIVELEKGEVLFGENGARSWSKGPITTENKAMGGIGKSIGRLFSGESFFMSYYTAEGHAEIAFASSFPGKIVARELADGESLICQKSAFLAATEGVTLSTFFQKKLKAGFFGGEGFIMQKVTGPGTVFVEIDGHCAEYDLADGEEIVCDTGLLAMCDETCKIDARTVGGIKNALFGGEGLFDTVIIGPGKCYLQSMTISQLAKLIFPPTNK